MEGRFGYITTTSQATEGTTTTQFGWYRVLRIVTGVGAVGLIGVVTWSWLRNNQDE
jgi:hypothetical protein